MLKNDLPNDTSKSKTSPKPTEKISPQATANTKNQDRTPNGETSRGVDEGAIEVGATGKRGQFGG